MVFFSSPPAFKLRQTKTMGSITRYPRSLYSPSTLYPPSTYTTVSIYLYIFLSSLYLHHHCSLFNFVSFLTLFFFLSLLNYTHILVKPLRPFFEIFSFVVNLKFWHLGFVQIGSFLSGYVLVSLNLLAF